MRGLLHTLFLCLFLAAAGVAFIFLQLDPWLWKTDIFKGTELHWRVVIPLALAAASAVGLLLVNLAAVGARLGNRRTLVALNVAVMIVLALGVAVILNLIAYRRYRTFDWTFRGLYALSDRTESVLSHLETKVTAHVLALPNELAGELLPTVRNTLDMYRAASKGELEVELIDPSQGKEKLLLSLKDLGVDPKTLDDPDIIIFSADTGHANLPRTKIVPFRDLRETDYSGGMERERLKGFKVEEQFTKAILDVTRASQTVVYTLGGHGELGSGRDAGSLERLTDTLKNLSYKVESFSFNFGEKSPRADVPADCDALIVAGPKARLEDKEIAAIKAYLGRGGRVLLLAGPVVRPRPGTKSVFFDDVRADLLTKDYGISLQPAYIFEPSSSAGRGFAFYLTADGVANNHPVTKPLVGRNLLFVTAQPLKVGAPADPTVKNQAILETTADGIAIKDLDAVQRTGNPSAGDHDTGPLTLAAIATRECAPATATAKLEARLVVVGDESIAVDDVVGLSPTNLDFLVNAVGWLTARTESVSIAAKAPEIIRLRLDERQQTWVKFMVMVDLPGLCLLVGLIVVLGRRS